jgi:hypothetical protein
VNRLFTDVEAALIRAVEIALPPSMDYETRRAGHQALNRATEAVAFLDGMDRAVAIADLDRSKFVRAAVREKISREAAR